MGARSITCPEHVRHSYIAISRYFSTSPRAHRSGACHRHGSSWTPSSSRSLKNSSLRRYSSTFETGKYRQFFELPKASHIIQDLDSGLLGRDVVLHGYLGSRADMSKKLTFVPLIDSKRKHSVQIISFAANASSEAHLQIKSLPENTPVSLSGRVKPRKPAQKPSIGTIHRIDDVEIELLSIQPLNVASNHDAVGPESEHRYVTLRSDEELRKSLELRSRAGALCRATLNELGFVEIETPLLFKSTPEGAREFIVPTRRPNLAYALPQSPQQYKQVLMAGGISRYFQLAKCFRDEDLRADRQPEFTQLDLEMSFARGDDVMLCIENLLRKLWAALLRVELPGSFDRLTYEKAMSSYGSDKPDRRIGMEIHQIDYMLPADLVSKIGPLTDPIVDVLKFHVSDVPRESQQFIREFMDSKEASDAGVHDNPDGQPGIFIFDSSKPLSGLQPFGFQAAEELETILELSDGDVVVLQARRRGPFAGGSTALGKIRLALQREAVARDLTEKPGGYDFLWVVEFPMFKPNDEDPGQGGSTGFSSTHHPFTAPNSLEDLQKLSADPTAAKSEHYDIVVNGVELGGGSRRIHDAELQEYVLREVLRMPDERVADFAHLLKALRSGCPPHAGIALGFDRLIAVMAGKSSIKDVIAFPKNSHGEDLLVNSPSTITDEQLETYHLRREQPLANPR